MQVGPRSSAISAFCGDRRNDLVISILEDEVKHRRINRQANPQIAAYLDRYTLAVTSKPLQQTVDVRPLALRQFFDVQRELDGGLS